MFTEIQPKSKDFALNQNCWFLMILAKFYQKFFPNAKFGPVRPKELCVFFLCVFPLLLLLLLFFYSSPDLNFAYISHIYYKISVSKIQHFQLLIGHIPLRHPLCHVCKRAIDADAPPNSPPPIVEDGCTAMTAGQPCVAVVNFLVDELWNSLSL